MLQYAAMPDFTPVPVERQPRSLVVRDALNLLFHHRFHAPQDAVITLEINHVYLGNGGFILTVFRPRDEDTMDQMQECLNNLEAFVTQEYEGTGVFYAVQTDSQVVVLSCFPRLTPEQCRDNEIYDLAGRSAAHVRDLVERYWRIKLYTAVGQLVYTVDSIASAFFYVTELMEYKMFIHDDHHILYKPNTIQPGDITLSASEARQEALTIVNGLYAHEELDLRKTASALVQWMVSADSSMRNLHFLLTIFAQSLTEEMTSLGMTDHATINTMDIMGRIYNAGSMPDLILILGQILEELRDAYGDKAKNRWLRLADDVREYVRLHFRDPNLSVSEIAAVMGIQVSTLSAHFRNTVGTTLVGYIRQCRVECALQLLKKPDCSIRQAAEQSGFGSINTMYRAFHLTEGVSPGRMRQL